MLTYVHSMALRAILFVFVVLFTTNLFAQPRVNVPPLISAPIILYDEGNNQLPDGDYQVRVRLFDDLTGNTLFEEEHLAEVRHGICHLNIGLGKAIDSNGRAASGGLDYTHFLVEGDIGVEILVEGQSNPQLLTYLSSQPYSFISQMALSVPGESISSYHIKDQSISLEDLHPTVIAELTRGREVVEVEGNHQFSLPRITTEEVFLPDGVVLKNSGGDRLADVLHGFDRSLDTIREVHIKQRIAQVVENFNLAENNFNDLLQNEIDARIQGDNNLTQVISNLDQNLNNQITQVSNTVNNLAEEVVTQDELNFNIINGQVSDNQLSNNIVKVNDQNFQNVVNEVESLDNRLNTVEERNPIGSPYVMAYGTVLFERDFLILDLNPDNSFNVQRYEQHGAIGGNGDQCGRIQGSARIHVFFSEPRANTNYNVMLTMHDTIIPSTIRIEAKEPERFIVKIMKHNSTCITSTFGSFDFVVFDR